MMIDIDFISGGIMKTQFSTPMVLLALVPIFIFLFSLVRKDLNRKKIILLSLRTLVVLFILLALASPFVLSGMLVQKDATSITILLDKTASTRLFDMDTASSLQDRISEKVSGFTKNIRTRELSTQNSSAIGDFLYSEITGKTIENSVVVLVSDGNNNHGKDLLDVSSVAAKTKTIVLPFIPDERYSEVYISGISGPDSIVEDSEYKGSVLVKKIGSGDIQYTLNIYLDDSNIYSQEVSQTDGEFLAEFRVDVVGSGVHELKAEISPEDPGKDKFTINNLYYKKIETVAKPKVALVSANSQSRLSVVLDELYSTEHFETFSELKPRLNDFSVVVLDNIAETEIGADSVDLIRNYLSDGNGLLVVGGDNSFDSGGYYGTSLENFLPVRSSSKGNEQTRETAVVFVIDISGSTGDALVANRKIDFEKALAIQMLKDLSDRIYTGVVAFNTKGFVVSNIRKNNDIDTLTSRISSLRNIGGTYMPAGQYKARKLLEGFAGSKYIVIISDGITMFPQHTISEAKLASYDEITTYTVGVGRDTDSVQMKEIARTGGGMYFEPEETQVLKILFGDIAEESGDEKNRKIAVLVVDKNHFISKQLELTGRVSDLNRVTTKSNARTLVATQRNEPVLSVWRFGLGRVATLTIDDGAKWAKEMYTGENSKIITASVNWLAGDVSKGLGAQCPDSEINSASRIFIESDKTDKPSLVDWKGNKITLKRLDLKRFYSDVPTHEPGVFEIHSGTGVVCGISVNYPREYFELGINTELLSQVARVSSGKVYNSTSVDKLISEVGSYTKERSFEKVSKKEPVYEFFLIVAMLLFLLDVAVRRIDDIMARRSERRASGTGDGNRKRVPKKNLKN